MTSHSIWHAAGASLGSVLAAEHLLARQTDGRGWARDMVERLCADGAGRCWTPASATACARTIWPRTHHRRRAAGRHVPAGVACAWTFDDGKAAAQVNAACDEEVKLRVAYGKPTIATVDITRPDGSATARRPRSRCATC